MILQALCDYYDRKAADPESGIAPPGFEWKEIPFIIVIDGEGRFVTIEDTRSGEGKVRRGKLVLVPQGEKKTVGIKANLLWDSVEYALGANPRERADIHERSGAFRQRLIDALPAEDRITKALLQFLSGETAQVIGASAACADSWKIALEINANVTFRIDGDAEASVCEHFHACLASQPVEADRSGICLVLGHMTPIERLNPSIKGVRGAQSSGAALVSFNKPAFASFGKNQNFNAPISTAATFAYTTALNSLLGRDSKNKVQVGDATTVFWSERRTEFEDHFAAFFDAPQKDNPDRDIQAVEALLRSPQTGATPGSANASRFYVLGLAPNAARLSVRFWKTGTVADFAQKIRRHFDDLEVVRAPKDNGRYSLFWLLVELGAERKVDNVPPGLSGSIVRAILEGGPYPATMLAQAMRRIRAEQDISRLRVAMLKAYLNRYQRVHPNNQKEITVALDTDNENAGYRLGRLFAVLEKIQEDAQPGINATIRDRFYGAASTTPVTVFPRLLKLKNHHLSKLGNKAFQIAHERRLADIIGGLAPTMPSHLSLDDQARFAIGYYHQRQALFAKSNTSPTTERGTIHE